METRISSSTGSSAGTNTVILRTMKGKHVACTLPVSPTALLQLVTQHFQYERSSAKIVFQKKLHPIAHLVSLCAVIHADDLDLHKDGLHSSTEEDNPSASEGMYAYVFGVSAALRKRPLRDPHARGPATAIKTASPLARQTATAGGATVETKASPVKAVEIATPPLPPRASSGPKAHWSRPFYEAAVRFRGDLRSLRALDDLLSPCKSKMLQLCVLEGKKWYEEMEPVLSRIKPFAAQLYAHPGFLELVRLWIGMEAWRHFYPSEGAAGTVCHYHHHGDVSGNLFMRDVLTIASHHYTSLYFFCTIFSVDFIDHFNAAIKREVARAQSAPPTAAGGEGPHSATVTPDPARRLSDDRSLSGLGSAAEQEGDGKNFVLQVTVVQNEDGEYMREANGDLIIFLTLEEQDGAPDGQGTLCLEGDLGEREEGDEDDDELVMEVQEELLLLDTPRGSDSEDAEAEEEDDERHGRTGGQHGSFSAPDLVRCDASLGLHPSTDPDADGAPAADDAEAEEPEVVQETFACRMLLRRRDKDGSNAPLSGGGPEAEAQPQGAGWQAIDEGGLDPGLLQSLIKLVNAAVTQALGSGALARSGQEGRRRRGSSDKIDSPGASSAVDGKDRRAQRKALRELIDQDVKTTYGQTNLLGHNRLWELGRSSGLVPQRAPAFFTETITVATHPFLQSLTLKAKSIIYLIHTYNSLFIPMNAVVPSKDKNNINGHVVELAQHYEHGWCGERGVRKQARMLKTIHKELQGVLSLLLQTMSEILAGSPPATKPTAVPTKGPGHPLAANPTTQGGTGSANAANEAAARARSIVESDFYYNYFLDMCTMLTSVSESFYICLHMLTIENTHNTVNNDEEMLVHQHMFGRGIFYRLSALACQSAFARYLILAGHELHLQRVWSEEVRAALTAFSATNRSKVHVHIPPPFVPLAQPDAAYITPKGPLELLQRLYTFVHQKEDSRSAEGGARLAQNVLLYANHNVLPFRTQSTKLYSYYFSAQSEAKNPESESSSFITITTHTGVLWDEEDPPSSDEEETAPVNFGDYLSSHGFLFLMKSDEKSYQEECQMDDALKYRVLNDYVGIALSAVEEEYFSGDRTYTKRIGQLGLTFNDRYRPKQARINFLEGGIYGLLRADYQTLVRPIRKLLFPRTADTTTPKSLAGAQDPLVYVIDHRNALCPRSLEQMREEAKSHVEAYLTRVFARLGTDSDNQDATPSSGAGAASDDAFLMFPPLPESNARWFNLLIPKEAPLGFTTHPNYNKLDNEEMFHHKTYTGVKPLLYYLNAVPTRSVWTLLQCAETEFCNAPHQSKSLLYFGNATTTTAITTPTAGTDTQILRAPSWCSEAILTKFQFRRFPFTTGPPAPATPALPKSAVLTPVKPSGSAPLGLRSGAILKEHVVVLHEVSGNPSLLSACIDNRVDGDHFLQHLGVSAHHPAVRTGALAPPLVGDLRVVEPTANICTVRRRGSYEGERWPYPVVCSRNINDCLYSPYKSTLLHQFRTADVLRWLMSRGESFRTAEGLWKPDLPHGAKTNTELGELVKQWESEKDECSFLSFFYRVLLENPRLPLCVVYRLAVIRSMEYCALRAANEDGDVKASVCGSPLYALYFQTEYTLYDFGQPLDSFQQLQREPQPPRACGAAVSKAHLLTQPRRGSASAPGSRPSTGGGRGPLPSLSPVPTPGRSPARPLGTSPDSADTSPSQKSYVEQHNIGQLYNNMLSHISIQRPQTQTDLLQSLIDYIKTGKASTSPSSSPSPPPSQTSATPNNVNCAPAPAPPKEEKPKNMYGRKL